MHCLQMSKCYFFCFLHLLGGSSSSSQRERERERLHLSSPEADSGAARTSPSSHIQPVWPRPCWLLPWAEQGPGKDETRHTQTMTRPGPFPASCSWHPTVAISAAPAALQPLSSPSGACSWGPGPRSHAGEHVTQGGAPASTAMSTTVHIKNRSGKDVVPGGLTLDQGVCPAVACTRCGKVLGHLVA